MTITACLEMGESLGFKTVGETIDYIVQHLTQLFSADKISEECRELVEDFNRNLLNKDMTIMEAWLQIIGRQGLIASNTATLRQVCCVDAGFVYGDHRLSRVAALTRLQFAESVENLLLLIDDSDKYENPESINNSIILVIKYALQAFIKAVSAEDREVTNIAGLYQTAVLFEFPTEIAVLEYAGLYKDVMLTKSLLKEGIELAGRVMRWVEMSYNSGSEKETLHFK